LRLKDKSWKRTQSSNSASLTLTKPSNMNSSYMPSLIGFTGLLGTLTLESVNAVVAICVGLATLTYLAIKIIKEIK
jgi:hypothetical protein